MEPVRTLHLAPTTARTAERGRFENALRGAAAATAGQVGQALSLAAPIVPGGAILAGALRGATSSPGALKTGAGLEGSAGGDVLDATRALQTEAQTFNLQYLALQENLQRESREFTAVSNVMKVRHDTAKTAIQNIH